jgi:hypothetical protein
LDSFERRLNREERALARDVQKKCSSLPSLRVEQATRDTVTWTRYHTKTYNEHWQEEGCPSPYEPFPKHEYFEILQDIFDLQPVTWIEKSRDVMVSWFCVAYFTLQAMRVPHRGVVFQTQKEAKGIQLVEYSKHLYQQSDSEIRATFPLSKPLVQQPVNRLEFENGSYVMSIPGGADQIRSLHPWGFLNDESSFQPHAGESFNEAISAVKGKIIFNSSAGPGWFADARRDIIRTEE